LTTYQPNLSFLTIKLKILLNFEDKCQGFKKNSCMTDHKKKQFSNTCIFGTRDVNRVPRGAVLDNFAVYQPRRVTFKCVKPRQRGLPRERSSNDESLQNEKTFSKLLS